MADSGIVLLEGMDGGLVTARDPSTLRNGELQQCDNTMYRPNDQAIFKATGRTVWTSTGLSTTRAKGLRALSFDDLANPWLIAHHSTSYSKRELAAETTGTFTSISADMGAGETLDAVHYNNKHYLFNGVAATDAAALKGNNHAVKSNGTDLVMRRHGLAPVVSTSGITVSAGVWPNTTTHPLGWYFFITTEVHDWKGKDELESAFEGTPAVALIDSALEQVVLTFPALVNDGTESDGTALINCRRVYMSTAQGTQPNGTVDATQPDFPSLDSYSLVAEVAYATGTQSTSIGNDGTGVAGRFPGSEADITGAWTNKSNDRADDNAVAASPTSGGVYVAYNFGFSGITGAVQGIEVEIKWRTVAVGSPLANDHRITVQLTKTGGTTNTLVGLPITRNTGTTYTHSFRTDKMGGTASQWGTTWALGDINAASGFGAIITSTPGTNYQTWIDYIKIRVWTGVLQSTGQPYPTVSINVGDLQIVESANSEPPIASTGDIFESQLVLDDVSNRAIMRYSIPDAVEYFPKDYYLQFSSKEQDEVTAIRRLGNKLIVGLKHQIHRVNYLPRQLDSEFDRGRAVEAISESHGIIGTQASCLFSPPDKPQLLAYVSSQGIHATDGYQTTTLSEDLDWQNTMAQAYLHQCVLVNYPKLYMLVLYYTAPGATTNKKALYFNYHPSHVKEGGKLLVSGPNDVSASSACLARKANEWVLFTGIHDDTLRHVYIEDRGYDDASGLIDAVAGKTLVKTRDIYAATIGYEWTLERTWVRHYAYSPTLSTTMRVYVKNTESTATQPAAAVDGIEWSEDTFTNALHTLSRLDTQHVVGESMQFEMTHAQVATTGNAGWGVSYLAIEAHGHGLSDNPGA